MLYVIGLAVTTGTFVVGMLLGYITADNRWLKVDNTRKDLMNRQYEIFGDD